MTNEESKLLSDFVILLLLKLKANSTDNLYYKINDESSLVCSNAFSYSIFSYKHPTESVSFALTDDIKCTINKKGIDLDDYFNVSLTKDLVLRYNDLKIILELMSKNTDYIQIVINDKLLEHIQKEGIDYGNFYFFGT